MPGPVNRPLARFCRYCQDALPDGWFSSALAADPIAPTGSAAPPLHLGPSEPILCLSDFLDHQEAPVQVAEVAGRIFVATSSGRFLLVEPFARHTEEPVLRRPWSAVGQLHLHAGGVWLVLSCEQGIQALDLLPLDAPR